MSSGLRNFELFSLWGQCWTLWLGLCDAVERWRSSKYWLAFIFVQWAPAVQLQLHGWVTGVWHHMNCQTLLLKEAPKQQQPCWKFLIPAWISCNTVILCLKTQKICRMWSKICKTQILSPPMTSNVFMLISKVASPWIQTTVTCDYHPKWQCNLEETTPPPHCTWKRRKIIHARVSQSLFSCKAEHSCGCRRCTYK